MKRVCIVGAGLAGLCAIKHCIASNLNVVAFETIDQVGGTWVYTDQVGKDQYGLPIHTSMYQKLLTNGPMVTMEFPDFPNSFENRSFITSTKMVNYINRYADEFKLWDKIKFRHHVVTVRPLPDESWEVIVKILPENKYETFIFDAVFVCNGRSVSYIPEIDGKDIFKGKQLHSHDYRTAESFINEKILIIGAGPSGIEIALQLGTLRISVFWSNHMLETYGRQVNVQVAEAVVPKVDVLNLTENGVIFKDGTFEEISTVIYATGYSYQYPFLVDCELSTDGKHVYPLYKHCININLPTMALINVPYFGAVIPMIDLQIRFVLKYWTGLKKLPCKIDMMKSMLCDQNKRLAKGYTLKKAHYLGPEFQQNYFTDLSEIAEIEPLRPVIAKIYCRSLFRIFDNFNSFRNYDYKIIDDENFEDLLGDEICTN